MDALSPGLVFIWLLAAAVATAIGRLAESYDRPIPWVSIVPFTVAGAVLGGLVGLAVDDTVAASTVGAGIGAGAALAARVILAVQRSKQPQ